MKLRLMVLVFVIGLVATACGGNGDSSSGVASLDTGDAAATDNATSGEQAVDEVNQEQAMLDFAACMRSNGVEIEDPTVDADGNVQFGGFRGASTEDGEIDREAIRTAREACEEELEGVALGFGGRGDIDITELQDTMVEYASCMRTNGYDMDDPDFSNLGPGAGGDREPGEGGGPFGAIDQTDPDFISAQEVCQDVLGGFGPGSGPGLGRGGDNG